jgi:hypothetical protein
VCVCLCALCLCACVQWLLEVKEPWAVPSPGIIAPPPGGTPTFAAYRTAAPSAGGRTSGQKNTPWLGERHLSRCRGVCSKFDSCFLSFTFFF